MLKIVSWAIAPLKTPMIVFADLVFYKINKKILKQIII